MATIKIPNVTLRQRPGRDGQPEIRPRFEPGPQARRKGWRPQDLKHPDGRWYSVKEAMEWAETRNAAMKAATARRAVVAAQAPRAGISLAKLMQEFLASPRLNGQWVVEGKRREKPLGRHTARQYRSAERTLAAIDPELMAAPAAALDQQLVYDLTDALWAARGLAMARATLRGLSAAISWGRKTKRIDLREQPAHPCEKLKIEGLAPRLRCGEPAEMAALVTAADAMGRPDVGDAIMLGLWTGQRQNDRLALVDAGLRDGRRMFRQSKTGAIVAIPPSPELEARLDAARARRARRGIAAETILWNEQEGRSWLGDDGDRYRKSFAAVRAEATRRTASLAGFRDQDLRDTAVTWLGRAGCTIPEITAITGHSLQSATTVLSHYLAAHPEMADSAMAKMTAWYEKAAPRAAEAA